MSAISDEHPTFVWTPELYEVVRASGLRPTDFNVAKLEQWYQALNGSRIAPRSEAARRSIPDAIQGEGWRDIASAPKDDKILLASFMDGRPVWVASGEIWQTEGWCDFTDNTFEVHEVNHQQPTHWRPMLAAAPQPYHKGGNP
jgi:hypothetical protein